MAVVQKEVQALLLDPYGKIPVALRESDVVSEAIAMRDRIGTDYAVIYLQFKGMSLDKALDILKKASPST